MCKCVDFGLSKNATQNDLMDSMAGTPYYMAPEVLKNENYDSSVDIWSLGVVLFTCLGGYRPFTGDDVSEITKSILSCNYKFHQREWSSISRDAKDLISMMLKLEPEKRITAEKALKHPWFGLITEIKLMSTLVKENKVRSKTVKKLKKFSQGSPLRQCTLELLIKMLSEDEKKAYVKEFNKFDLTRKGTVSYKEFMTKIKETEDKMTDKEIKKMAKELDHDQNDNITYSDFITATLDVKKALTKERLQTIFNKFDTQGEFSNNRYSFQKFLSG